MKNLFTFIVLGFVLVSLSAPAFASSSNISKSSITATSSDESIDSILDQYDKIVTDYVALSKKVMAGDMSVMAEYTKKAEEMSAISVKLAGVATQLNEKQQARLHTISEKLAAMNK